MTKDEIAEYFSRDIDFDWPESYTPRFPLTDAEQRLAEMNRLPANFVDYTHGKLSLVPINAPGPEEWLEGRLHLVVEEEKKMWSEPEGEKDVP
jgi:hypothetical protein